MRVLSRLLSPAVALLLIATMSLVDAPGVSAATISKKAKESFIAGLVAPAQQAQRSYGVPASVSMAQAIVNSDWGTSAPARQAKNYLGVTCVPKMTSTQFAQVADDQVGKPYVLGAEASASDPSPRKFDCSELVEWLYARSGNRITDLAAWQYNATKKVSGSPKVGDLVFLRNNPARSNGIGHVAIVTGKLDNGGWRVIEARGRAYGVVRTTLSYWKNRKYYAGLRRQASFSLAGKDSAAASASRVFQNTCVTIGKVRYAKYRSLTDGFAAHAAAVAEDSRYAAARKVMGDVGAFVTAIAKVERPKSATSYAAKLKAVIAEYDLGFYDNVAFNLVLLSGDSGPKVTALQYLLNAAGYAVATTGKYDSATTAAVKKFQKAKKLEVDGEAGPITINSLTPSLSSGAKGDAVRGLAALLVSAGQPVEGASTFGTDLVAAVKAFQGSVGLSVTGIANDRTWAALFMTLEGGTPKVSGKAVVGKKLTAAAGKWGPGSVKLSYQWYRGTTRIGGATSSTRTVTVDDAGQSLRVKVTGKRQLYTPTVRTSSATATVPRLTLKTAAKPTISGAAKAGSTLTAKAGSWAPAPVTFSYQWYRGSARIAGATAASYTVTAADGGAALRVAVTGTKTGYAAVTTKSAATATVPRQLTAPTPTITGTRKAGKTLKVKAGAWGPGSVALSYRWYRGSTLVKGATTTRFKLTAKDKGAKVSVVVRGSKAGYATAEKKATVEIAE
ncbi:MAG: peptidoglycan-binding protein [Micropruina sp.]